MKILGLHIPYTAEATPTVATVPIAGSKAPTKTGVSGSGVSTLSSVTGTKPGAVKNASSFLGKVASVISFIPRKILSAIAWILGTIFAPVKYLFVKTPKQILEADKKAIEQGKFSGAQARAKLAKLPEGTLKLIFQAVGDKQRGSVMSVLQMVNPFAYSRVALGQEFVATNDSAAIQAYKGHLDQVLAS